MLVDRLAGEQLPVGLLRSASVRPKYELGTQYSDGVTSEIKGKT